MQVKVTVQLEGQTRVDAMLDVPNEIAQKVAKDVVQALSDATDLAAQEAAEPPPA